MTYRRFSRKSAEKESAPCSLSVLPAVKAFSANIERFLEANKDFALEFGGLARNALYLAQLYLSEGERSEIARKYYLVTKMD